MFEIKKTYLELFSIISIISIIVFIFDFVVVELLVSLFLFWFCCAQPDLK